MTQVVVTDSVAAADPIWQKFVASVGKKPLSDTTSPDLRDEDADKGGNLGINPQPYMAAKTNTMGSLPSVMVERPMVANGRMAQVTARQPTAHEQSDHQTRSQPRLRSQPHPLNTAVCDLWMFL